VKKFALALICCAATSGCVTNFESWPSAGTGGFAEWEQMSNPRVEALDAQLRQARLNGAETFAAGAYADAELLLTRCRRELAGGLQIDADADLDRLQIDVTEMNASLGKRARKWNAS
jgi:hypothetical protein